MPTRVASIAKFGRGGCVARDRKCAKLYAEANEFYELALQQSKPAEMGQLFLSWGQGLLFAERYDEAAQVFDRGIKKQVLPAGSPAFHFYLAGALEMAGKTDECRQR